MLVAAGCAIEKSSNPLSPTVAGPIAGVNITAPKPLEPISGQPISGDLQPVTLLLENALTTGERPLSYTFDVASDAGFANKVFSREGITPGDNGRTSLRLPDALGTGRGYYWRAKAQDGANAGPYSATANFNVVTPVSFDKPTPLSPINNSQVSSQSPDFKWGDAPRQGTPLEVGYVVEVATSDTFANRIAVWTYSEQPGQTSVAAGSALPPSAQIFWHVRAFQGGILGPWSDTQIFRTPALVSAPAPPAGGGGPSNCAAQPTALTVVQCERAKYVSTMSASQTLTFLRTVAKDLNAGGGGIAGSGPFGILQKPGGVCSGYSCDIICTGQGSAQKQWDVLGDSDGAQTPLWSGPSVYPNIRVDTCDIQ